MDYTESGSHLLGPNWTIWLSCSARTVTCCKRGWRQFCIWASLDRTHQMSECLRMFTKSSKCMIAMLCKNISLRYLLYSSASKVVGSFWSHSGCWRQSGVCQTADSRDSFWCFRVTWAVSKLVTLFSANKGFQKTQKHQTTFIFPGGFRKKCW